MYGCVLICCANTQRLVRRADLIRQLHANAPEIPIFRSVECLSTLRKTVVGFTHSLVGTGWRV